MINLYNNLKFWRVENKMNVNKEEILKLVDGVGKLHFDHWYKNSLFYKNKQYLIEIRPDYRDHCEAEETLENLLTCEDYYHVNVYDHTKLNENEKPTHIFYKKGDN